MAELLGADRRRDRAGRGVGRTLRRPAVRSAGTAPRRGRRHRHGSRRAHRSRRRAAAAAHRPAERPHRLRRGHHGAANRIARPERGPRPRRARPARLRRGHPDDEEHGRRARRLRVRRASCCTPPTRASTTTGTMQRDTVAVVVLHKLPLVDQLFHTVASPAVSYLLLLIGLALLIFEFFTAGVGIAGVVGAGSLVLACTGLAALPARGWAVGLHRGVDAGVRGRRAGGRPAVLDRRRHRRHGRSPAGGCSSRCRARHCGRRGSRCSPASAA